MLRADTLQREPKTEAASQTAHQDGEAGTRRHLRGSTLLLAGRMVALVLNLLVQILTVRYLAKADFGAFAYGLAVASMGASITVFGLEKTFPRFGPIYQEQQQQRRLLGGIVLSIGTVLALGAGGVLLVFAARPLLAEKVVNDPRALSLLLILISLAPLQALDTLLNGMLSVLARPRAIFVRRHILGPGLKLAVVVLLVSLHADVYFLAFGYLIAGLVGTGTYLVLLLHILHEQQLLQLSVLRRIELPIREFYSFAVPLLGSNVVFLLRGTLVVLLLEYFHSARGVAEFRAVLPIARLNELVFQSFHILFLPIAARLFAQQNHAGVQQLYWRTTAWITVFSFPVFLASFALAKPMTVFLFGSRYADSAIILAILSLGYFMHAVLGFSALTLRVYGKVRQIVLLDLAAAVSACVANVLLIPRFGAIGGAVATSTTLIIHGVLNQWVLQRTSQARLVSRETVKVYASAVGLTLIVLAVQLLIAPPLYVGLPLAAVGCVLFLWANHHVLELAATYPELLRLKLIRKLLGYQPG